jgi:diguanylate cyclase (GGDEF)-like protein
VDVDYFKDINDSLGHAQGDALLVEIAERMWPTCAGTTRWDVRVG